MDEKLWRKFSAYIRLRDTDHNYEGKCCTCGTTVDSTDADAGHYIPVGVSNLLKFLECNVHIQCKKCNQLEYGREEEYKEFMIQMYDEKLVEILEGLKHKMGKFDIDFYNKGITHYSAANKILVRLKTQDIRTPEYLYDYNQSILSLKPYIL